MKTVEISIDERIEAARARLKTAYDLMIQSGGAKSETEKWKVRRSELQQLLTQKQNSYATVHS